MNVFNMAMNVLFSDPNLQTTAVYVPMQGESKKVHVITHKPDAFVDVGNVGHAYVATSTLTLDVRLTDCPTLFAGDKFLIAGTMYTVQGSPKLCSVNLTYRVDLACD